MTRDDPTRVLLVHRRQFVLGPNRIDGRPDWIHDRVGRLWLSRCPELRVRRVADGDGAEWWLLGRAVQSDPDGPDPEDAIASASTGDVAATRRSWAGRWVLLGGETVYPDASALLGVLFGRTSEGIWASSSPTLLRRIVHGAPPPPNEPPHLFYECGLSWHPPPAGGWPGIRRLLPSQTLDLGSSEVRHAPALPPCDDGLTHEERLDVLYGRLVATIRGLCEDTPEPPWLGLSGGYDSRLMLALATSASLEVRPYTWLSARTAPADRHLPPVLANVVGVSHLSLSDRGRRAERLAAVLEHTGTAVSRGDAEPVLGGSRAALSGVSFGGHGFALATGFWRLHELPRRPGSAADAAQSICALFGERIDSDAGRGIEEWAEWAFRHAEPGLDWRDRFYLEQRQAGWLAAKEQLFDLAPLERFMPLNAASTYALVLGFDETWRHDFSLQVELIRRTAPALLEHPFNPPASAFGVREAMRRRARGLVRTTGRWARRLQKRMSER